jgi:hypothetical protein
MAWFLENWNSSDQLISMPLYNLWLERCTTSRMKMLWHLSFISSGYHSLFALRRDFQDGYKVCSWMERWFLLHLPPQPSLSGYSYSRCGPKF